MTGPRQQQRSGAGGDDGSHDFDDAPITEREDDRFGRWPFAERIAQVLASRQDSASIVIGLYGPWGDGKTSVLNLMAGTLNRRTNVVCVRFNPWYFDDPPDIIRSLFETIADHLESGAAGETAALLRRYGSMLSLSWKAPNEGDTLEDLPVGSGRRTISTFALETVKRMVSDALADSGMRLVVLVDDVDRLDPAGVLALLKLVNLSASLTAVSYVLAIDAAVVEMALGQRYGGGDSAAGRQFLEKIIQVPLHLPDAERVDLEAACLNGVNLVIAENGITFPAATREEYLRHFSRGLVPGLRTPRQVKRYINAIRFSVPLLLGEVHILDQLLIEGMRVVYPQLYVTARDHGDTFLGAGILARESGGLEPACVEVVESGLRGLDDEARDGALYLLRTLFPRLNSVFGKTTYAPQWDRTWDLERRIASRDYFRRYFQYSVPVRDVGDGDIARLVEACNEGANLLVGEFFALVRTRDAWAAAFRKIGGHIAALTNDGRESLVRGLAQASPLFPASAGSMATIAPSWQAASLIASVLDGVVRGRRDALAGSVVELADNLSFLAALFVEFTRETSGCLLIDRDSFAQAVSRRIGHELESSALEAHAEDLETLLSIWRECAGPETVRRFLKERIQNEPQSAAHLLNAFCRTGGTRGHLTMADLDEDRYRAFIAFVDPDQVASIFTHEFAALHDTMTLEEAYLQTGDARLAARFIVLHRGLSRGAG